MLQSRGQTNTNFYHGIIICDSSHKSSKIQTNVAWFWFHGRFQFQFLKPKLMVREKGNEEPSQEVV
jgi:hypothetical protein